MPFNWKNSSVLASSAMLIVTAIWGWTFVVVQNAINRMPVMDFLAWRFAVAALVMLAIRPNCLKGLTWQELWRGVLLGVILGLGYITQTYGLVYASASVSGFITGMFVVFTPLIAWLFMRKKINLQTWIAVVLATLGLGLLGLHGWKLGTGELLTLACALFYALHILGLGEWSSKYAIYRFALLQVMTVAVITVGARHSRWNSSTARFRRLVGGRHYRSHGYRWSLLCSDLGAIAGLAGPYFYRDDHGARLCWSIRVFTGG